MYGYRRVFRHNRYSVLTMRAKHPLFIQKYIKFKGEKKDDEYVRKYS